MLLNLNLDVKSEYIGKKYNEIKFPRNIIYVDDNNTQGPWNGSIDYPYQYIQDAINNSTNDDLIYVFSGLYFENFIIDKRLTLIGENESKTIIDGDYKNCIINISYDADFGTYLIKQT